jgi:hypothetical protein
MEQQPTPRTVVSPPHDENIRTASPTGRVRTNTDGSTSSIGTPRRTGMGIRSSISYSPAQNRTPMQDGFSGRGISFEARRSVDSNEGRDLMGLFEDNEGEEEVKGETLTERWEPFSCSLLAMVHTDVRHAELLTAIAQKERRVNELKQGTSDT